MHPTVQITAHIKRTAPPIPMRAIGVNWIEGGVGTCALPVVVVVDGTLPVVESTNIPVVIGISPEVTGCNPVVTSLKRVSAVIMREAPFRTQVKFQEGVVETILPIDI